MNILIVVDKLQSAIHRLAIPIQKHNPHLNIKILPVHPKRPDIEVLAELERDMRWADLIDVHYWRSGEVLKEHQSQLFKEKKKIVCHFNPYDVDKESWMQTYDAVTVGNQEIHTNVPYARLIPYAIDLDFWRFNTDHRYEKVVNMTVARIEGKKGVREVAQACKELGYKFKLVGRISDGNYFREIVEAGGDMLEFRENISDTDLKEVYYSSGVHVCNSVDGFESGTLPILEAMACGVPVITRNVGHVPDIADGTNMIVRETDQSDIEDIKLRLREVLENKPIAERLRNNGWNTVKNRNDKKMARQYAKLYYDVLSDNQPFASIIIPTYDRGESFAEVLAAAVTQDYPNYEVVVVDSGNDGPNVEEMVTAARLHTKVPIQLHRFNNHGQYTLSKARNIGVTESMGLALIFCDDRLVMEKNAVSEFMAGLGRNVWVWGIKDKYEKPFVENFSAVYRDDLIRFGMFNERMDVYGGTTQEIRQRFEKINGLFFKMVQAHARSNAKSGSKWRRKQDIIQAKFKLYKLYGQGEI